MLDEVEWRKSEVRVKFLEFLIFFFIQDRNSTIA